MAVTANLLPNGRQSFTTNTGIPLVGGLLYTYAAGTDTPVPTWKDPAQATPNTNPVVLNARGEAVIFWNGAYKIVLKDALGILIWTQDNVVAADAFASVVDALSKPDGATKVYTQRATLDTAAAYRALADKAADRFDFRDMAGADITGAHDMSPVLIKALANAKSTGDVLNIPSGVITLGSTVNINSGTHIEGVGTTPYTTLADGGSRGSGSWFHFAHSGIGFQLDEPGILDTGVSLRSIGTFRDQPVPAPGWAPNNHDFDIQLASVNLLLDDVCLLNPTNGVRQTAGDAGRLIVNHLHGQPFKVGVQIDDSYDGFIVDNIRWWPYWSNDQYTKAYINGRRRGMYLRHCDNPKVQAFFDYGSAFPLYIGSHPNGVVNNANFVNPEFDNYAVKAVFFEPGSDGSYVKLIGGYSYGIPTGDNAVEMSSNNAGFVAVSHKWQELPKRVLLMGSGTGNVAQIIGPEVSRWNNAGSMTDEAFSTTAGNRIFLEGEVRTAGGNGARVINDVGMISSSEYIDFPLASSAVTARTGMIAAASGTARVNREARTVRGKCVITVTDNGTGGGDLRVSLPIPVATGQRYSGVAWNTSTSDTIRVVFQSTLAILTGPNGSYPIASGQMIEFDLNYECDAL